MKNWTTCCKRGETVCGNVAWLDVCLIAVIISGLVALNLKKTQRKYVVVEHCCFFESNLVAIFNYTVLVPLHFHLVSIASTFLCQYLNIARSIALYQYVKGRITTLPLNGFNSQSRRSRNFAKLARRFFNFSTAILSRVTCSHGFVSNCFITKLN